MKNCTKSDPHYATARMMFQDSFLLRCNTFGLVRDHGDHHICFH